MKANFNSADICAIIESCGKARVRNLQLPPLEIDFFPTMEELQRTAQIDAALPRASEGDAQKRVEEIQEKIREDSATQEELFEVQELISEWQQLDPLGYETFIEGQEPVDAEN